MTGEAEVDLDASRFRARITCHGTFDAVGVEKLIWMLATCRMEMLPPRVHEAFPSDSILITEGGDWFVQLAREGIMVALMHPGLGWIGMFLMGGEASLMSVILDIEAGRWRERLDRRRRRPRRSRR